MQHPDVRDNQNLLRIAVDRHRQGDLRGALKRYRMIVDSDPLNADAIHLMGVVALQEGRLDEAAPLIMRAIRRSPDMAIYYVSLGDLYQQRGDAEKQIASYRRALAIDANRTEAWFKLGNAYADRHRFPEAIDCLTRGIAKRPDIPEFYNSLGEIYAFQKQVEAALTAFGQALERRPDYAEAMGNLANLLRDQGRFDEAGRYYRKALALEPNSAVLTYSLGIYYHMQHAYADARRCYQTVLEAHPQHYGVHLNMGKLYQDQNDYAKAITYFARAEKIDPTKGEARFYRSLILLTRGQFKKGWALYEARFEKETWHTIYPYRLATPRWQGEPLDGKTIFVHSEQGFGDIIQFVRFLPLLKRRGGRVIFEVRPELVDLLRGFPGIDFLVPMAKKPPTQSGIDYHIPLLSLPGRFDTDMDTIPGTAPYLQADPVKVRTWQARVSPDHVNVGLVWLAKPSYRHNKSCPLEQFRALLAMPTVRVVGLQTFDNPQDRSGLATHITNWGEHFNSFADTAAAIHCLDLVIAVDTAVAHLAGALGRPVWTLLPFSADWRWLTERTDSPWYPSMTLYRQAAVDEWDEVVERIVTDMHRFKRAAG